MSSGKHAEILTRSAARWVALLLFAIIVVIGAFTFRDYGFNSDDTPGYIRAVNLYKFLVSDLPLSERLAAYKISTYGAMPDLIAYLLQLEFPSLSYDSRLLVSWIFGVVGIYYTYRLADAFVGRLAGLAAAVILAVNPMWYGYMFINVKDIPFAALLMASLYYCLLKLSGKDDSKGLYAKIAVSVGLLSVTKLIGVVILGFCVGVHLYAMFGYPDHRRLLEKQLIRRMLVTGLAGLVGTIVSMMIFMPQIYTLDPLVILNSVFRYVNFETWSGPLLLNGETYRVGNYPRSYMTIYMAVSMPLLILGLALASLPLQLVAPNRAVISAVVIVATFLVYQAATNARVYNAYRHFIFLLPFISIAAGSAAATILSMRMSPTARSVAGVLMGGGLVAILISNYALHPYQYTFYNQLVGGLKGADGRFDVDSRRTAAREAHAILDRQAKDSGSVFTVYSCSDQFNFWNFDHLRRTKKMEEADFLVSTTRICALNKFKAYKMVDSVRRDGVILSGIYDARSPGQQ